MRGRLAQGEPHKVRSDIRSHRRPFLRSEAGYLLIVTVGDDQRGCREWLFLRRHHLSNGCLSCDMSSRRVDVSRPVVAPAAGCASGRERRGPRCRARRTPDHGKPSHPSPPSSSWSSVVSTPMPTLPGMTQRSPQEPVSSTPTWTSRPGPRRWDTGQIVAPVAKHGSTAAQQDHRSGGDRRTARRCERENPDGRCHSQHRGVAPIWASWPM